MKAIELLCAAQVSRWFARMEDGSYRWVSEELELLPDGPDSTWVEQAVRTPDASGLPLVHPVQDQEENLSGLNANIEAASQAGGRAGP